jgi:FSR family fosmidomycin resistance protein-like MFS transporter
LRRVALFPATLLIIEFLDEFVFGAREAAWPLIRADLGLDYAQVGLLLGIPSVFASLIEPSFGILADTGRRRGLILGGGVVFGLALAALALSGNFWAALIASLALYPASGAFVSLSQATLMDLEPARHDQNMARWTLAGSVGVVAGPLALGAAVWAGLGWRGTFLMMAALALLVLALAWRQAFPPAHPEAAESFRAGLAGAARALRRGEVLRWLTLLQFSDFMLDVLLGYLALYFVDVVGVDPAQAGVAVAVWTGVGLLGDALLIPLLERMAGLRYLRFSAALMLGLYPALLLVPGFWLKLVVLAFMGLFNAGWYAILQGRLYAAMPGQSGTVTTLSNVFGLVGGLVPLAIGLIAEGVGLGAAMWALIAGPVALLLGLPHHVPPGPEPEPA